MGPIGSVLSMCNVVNINRMKISSALVAVAALMLLTSCRVKDIRTIEISVPDMKNAACAEIVRKAVLSIPNVTSGEVDLQHRTVVVTYDSIQLSLKNIEFGIADAGFSADMVPANDEARKKLPPECLSDAPLLSPSNDPGQFKINLAPLQK
jgi:copper chaperone CopZ